GGSGTSGTNPQNCGSATRSAKASAERLARVSELRYRRKSGGTAGHDPAAPTKKGTNAAARDVLVRALVPRLLSVPARRSEPVFLPRSRRRRRRGRCAGSG